MPVGCCASPDRGVVPDMQRMMIVSLCESCGTEFGWVTFEVWTRARPEAKAQLAIMLIDKILMGWE